MVSSIVRDGALPSRDYQLRLVANTNINDRRRACGPGTRDHVEVSHCREHSNFDSTPINGGIAPAKPQSRSYSQLYCVELLLYQADPTVEAVQFTLGS